MYFFFVFQYCSQCCFVSSRHILPEDAAVALCSVYSLLFKYHLFGPLLPRLKNNNNFGAQRVSCYTSKTFLSVCFISFDGSLEGSLRIVAGNVMKQL